MAMRLKPEQENRVEEALQTGAYGSAEDVIDRALEALRERDEWLAINREAMNLKIQKGLEELERGEGIPEHELDGRLRRLKAQPEGSRAIS